MAQADAMTLGALIAWYEAMGADEAIGDSPVDRFAPGAIAAKTRTKSPATRAESQATPAQSRARSESQAIPASLEAAATLAELEALLAQFEGCALKRTAKSLCFARGSASARIMLIGEAPGLEAIGLSEEHVYITNTIYWRPPGNRTPTPQEIEACAPFLARQIELLSPDVMVLLGGAAAKSILGVTEGIMRLRGRWKLYQSAGREIPTLATLHPAYLLRTPDAKRYAWRDLLMLKEKLGETAT
jgi:uracil-DNA glycosylase